ncbi:carboxypeptidase-like regulatory domain-containing protein [Flavobacteriaceae bacterium D16]|nr:carboxypeptidase-like regulatory domain-containing protein [Flavobacteriaceae bacterium D16]
MIRKLLVFLFVLAYSVVHAQLAFEGEVLDAATGKPIPFVNIGIVDRGIGTITNENGEFLLEFRRSEVDKGDIIRISSLGYLSHEIPITLLKKDVLKLIIRLKPKAESLDEVVVTNKNYERIEDEVGYRNLSLEAIGYWKDSVALGGELASAIRVKKGLRRLNTLYFKILHNPSDSIRIRVNIYEPQGKWKKPGKNLNESGNNIIHVLRNTDLLAVIDLKPYDIWVRDDFIVSLELLGVYGTENISLSLPAGKVNSTRSFRRYASQGSWELMGMNVLGFGVQSTYYAEKTRKSSIPRQTRKREERESEISGYVITTAANGNYQVISRRSGATITNYTSNVSVKTDKLGRYRLKVVKGDILGVSYPGTRKLLMEVEEPNDLIFRLDPEKN